MARDASGNYTLPAGNPVVSGTLIESNWANPTMSDLGNETSDSLSRSGKGGMLAQFKAIDGTVGNPGISFLDQLSLGMYRASSGDMRVSVSGTDSMRWISTGPQIWDGAQWNDILTGSNAVIDGPDPTLADDTAALTTGAADPSTEPHIAYGLTTIQAKSNSTIAASMTINPYGGDTLIGARIGGGPIGEVQIWHDGTQSLRTINAGVTIGLSSTNNIQIANNVIDSLNNGVAEKLDINPTGASVQIGNQSGENIVISGRNISAENNGTGTTIQINPAGGSNAGVSLFWQGSKMAETVNSTIGGLFVNNGSTGIGLERVLTVSDRFSDPSTTITASRNFAFTDVGLYLIRGGPGNFTLTLPANIATGADRFAEIVIDNIDDVDSGTITIATSGTTVRTNSSGNLVIQPGETAYLKQTATLNTWRLKK